MPGMYTWTRLALPGFCGWEVEREGMLLRSTYLTALLELCSTVGTPHLPPTRAGPGMSPAGLPTLGTWIGGTTMCCLCASLELLCDPAFVWKERKGLLVAPFRY